MDAHHGVGFGAGGVFADWHELHHVLPSNNLGATQPLPTTSLCFDAHAELLWSANLAGQLTSYYSSSHFARYTSVPAHRAVTRQEEADVANASMQLQSGAPASVAASAVPVRGLLVDDRAVYALGRRGLKCCLRRGPTRWDYALPQDDVKRGLSLSSFCFSPVTTSSDIILGGGYGQEPYGQGKEREALYAVNRGTGAVVRQGSSDAPLTHLRASQKYLVASTRSGHLQLRDPRSLSVEHRLHAFPGGLIDVVCEGWTMCSVGWTLRLGHPVPEPLIKVHDLRTLRPLVPLPFSSPGGPSLLAQNPASRGELVVMAPSGSFQVVDIGNPGAARFYQLNTASFPTAMAVSSSGECLAIAETDGSLRLWVNAPHDLNAAPPRFNSYSVPEPEMPDVLEQPEPILWQPDTPLSSIGMPYYDEPLFSAIDYKYYASEASPLFNPPPKIDPAILANLRTVDRIAYAPLPRHLRGKRNMVRGAGANGQSAAAEWRARGVGGPLAPGARSTGDRRRAGLPLFRSEREKERAKRLAEGVEPSPSDAARDDPLSPSESGQSLSEALGAASSSSARADSVPSYYRVKTIEYSRFGVEDFDFGYYNRTRHSGLETHIQNSYANAYLQALHYLPAFRRIATAHTLDDGADDDGGGGGEDKGRKHAAARTSLPACAREGCLLCEAGFLFKMLDDARGANCQATNFLRAFGNSDKAASLGLMDNADSPGADMAYSQLVQTLNRFMLDAVCVEAARSATATPSSSAPGSGRPTNPSRSPQPSPADGSRASGARAKASSGARDAAGAAAEHASSSPSGTEDPLARRVEGPLLERLLGTSIKARTVCGSCSHVTERNLSSHVVDLVYPRRGLSNEPAPPSDFASVVRGSLIREASVKAACRSCGAASVTLKTRRVLPRTAELPHALSINANVQTPEQLAHWLDAPAAASSSTASGAGAAKKPPPKSTAPSQGTVGPGRRRTYLPWQLRVRAEEAPRGDALEVQQVRVTGRWADGDGAEAAAAKGAKDKEEGDTQGKDVAVYEIRSLVVEIQADKEAPHLCALVRMPEEARDAARNGGETNGPTAAAAPWYLFNDFLVRRVTEAEAMSFAGSWKIPAVVFYERVDRPLDGLDRLPRRMDAGILCRDLSIAWHRDPKLVRYSLLSGEEVPGPGTLVAIDAEFVALNQEELEVRSDGTRSLIRPSRLSLARVSVLRGQGGREGEPFIDDHIHTREPVVDYLTQFSGIQPGDLDPATSKHTLVPLKEAYKKLRLLVDLGCRFVGHGLKKDFRIINIFVPPEQVVDTVDLYQSPAHPRKLSLRFLSWFLLKQDIQSGGGGVGRDPTTTAAAAAAGHDSIEDAWAALRLFRLWEQFERDGRLETVLEDLYETGARLNWRPPPSASQVAAKRAAQVSAAATPTGSPSKSTWPSLGGVAS